MNFSHAYSNFLNMTRQFEVFVGKLRNLLRRPLVQ